MNIKLTENLAVKARKALDLISLLAIRDALQSVYLAAKRQTD